MKTSLLKGSITYAAATIVSRIAVIILIPILTRIMSVEEYGAVNIMITIVQLANFILTLEVTQSVTLFYTRQSDPQQKYFPATALWFIVGVYSIIIILAALFLNLGQGTNISGASISPQLIFSSIVLLACNGFFLLVQNQLRLEFKSTAYGVLTFLYVLLTCVAAVLGAKYYSQPAVGVIGGQALGAAIAGIVTFLFIKQKFSFGFKRDVLQKMLQYSLPLVPASFFLLGSQQAAKLILGMYGTMEQVGIFGLAMQIAGFSGLALIGVQTAITPSVLANHQHPETPQKLGFLFEVFFSLSLLFCVVLSVFSKELIIVFSTNGYLNAAYYVPVLAFAIAFNGLYIFFPGKIIKGKSSLQLLASVIGFVVSVIAASILIKIDGIRGAAISTLLSSAAFFFSWYTISQKLYHVPVNWKKLGMVALFAIAIASAVILLVPSGITGEIIFIKLLTLLVFTTIVGYSYISKLRKTYLAGRKK